MADQLVYELSSSSEIEDSNFVKKDWVYINDLNNSSYSSGVVLFETSALSNAGKWANYEEAYITIPIVVVLSAQTMTNANVLATTFDWTTIAGEFVSGLKNGYHHIIHSMNVEYNNSTVIQNIPFQNFYISYSLNTSLSQDDLQTIAPSINFYPDSSQSWQYSTATGSQNNNNFDNVTFCGGAGFAANAVATANQGLIQRQLNCNYVVNATTGANALTSAANLTKVAMNQVTNTATYQKIEIMCKIPLKFLHSLFAKMPLCKGSFFKFYINTNQSSFQVTKPSIASGASYGATSLWNFVPSSMSIIGGATNMLMITANNGSSATAGSGGVVIPSALGKKADTATNGTGGENSTFVNCSLSIVKCASAAQASLNIVHSQSTCRLYCPMYTMNPISLERYISSPQKKIVFTDLFSYQLLNQGAGANINQLITNGIKNIQRIVMMPFISVTTTSAISPIISPFSSEPATCSPLSGCLTEVNIMLGGSQLEMQNLKYGYESFIHEVYGVGAVNGGYTTGLNSGLISETDWNNNYGYYVFDCRRHLIEESGVPKSIQLIATNNSLVPIDLYIFVEFEKSITLDVTTGARIN